MVMDSSSSWFVIRIFKAASNTLFTETFFLLGLTEMGRAVPCLFGLLPNKEHNTYKQVASCIRDQWKSLANVKVKSIHKDFEKGLISAFNSSFPGVDISSCEFHWKSCLCKRIAAGGLMVIYNSNIKMQQLLRFIWAWSMSPATTFILT